MTIICACLIVYDVTAMTTVKIKVMSLAVVSECVCTTVEHICIYNYVQQSVMYLIFFLYKCAHNP